MKNLIIKFLALIVIATGLSVGAASLAFAHATQITGVSACQGDGTYTVTWKVANDYNSPENVTLVSVTGGGTLTGLPASIATSPSQPYKFATVTQTGVPGTTVTAKLTVKGVWTSDNYTQNDSGVVALAGNCKISTTASVQFQEPTCANTNTAAIFGQTNTDKITYVTTGTVAPGQHVVVNATAKAGYTLTGPTSFAHDFTAVQDCRVLVTPAAPTVNRTETCAVQDTFVAGPTEHVTYVPANGSLAEGQTVSITATPDAGYKFSPDTANVVFQVTGQTVEVCATVPPTTQPPVTTIPATTIPATIPPTTVPEVAVTEPPVSTTVQIPTTTPAPVAPVFNVTADTTVLPATGTSSDGILIAAWALVLLGMIAYTISRRKTV